MNHLSIHCTEQYKFVKSSRSALLEYCATISTEKFTGQNSGSGRGGSIRNLLVHIANVYEHWIANIALHRNVSFTAYASIANIKTAIALFDAVDQYMNEYFLLLEEAPGTFIHYEINGSTGQASLLKLFTHVITHEYHHKGQVLSLSRQLGYVPADTDIIR